MATGVIDKIEKQTGDPSKGGAFWTIQIGDCRYMYFEAPCVNEGDKVEFRNGKTRSNGDYIVKGSLHKLTENAADPPTTASGQAAAERSAAGSPDASPYRSPNQIQAASVAAIAKDLTLAWAGNASQHNRELLPVMLSDTCYQMTMAVAKMVKDAAKELEG